MDGLSYVDSKAPFMTLSGSIITLTTVYQPLVPAANLPILGNNYFNWVGKAVRIRAFGVSTSGTTPGNYQIGLLYGDGSPNAGVSVAGLQGGWTASLTQQCWIADFMVRCRSTGPAGTLLAQSFFLMQGWGIGSIPPFNAAPVTCDLTQPFYLNLQALRTGSTSETWQLHEIMYEAMN